MKFFCLTSITAEKPLQDEKEKESAEIEYQNLIKAVVEVHRSNPKDYERFEEEEIQDFKEYLLTEIEIGFDENYKVYNDDGDIISQKFTYLFMFRRNDRYFEIRMEPGAIKIIEIDWKNFIIDLDISKENVGNIVLAKTIRIRDIKNTPDKEMKKEDYKNYETFLNNIKEYCDKSPTHSIEEAFGKIKMKRTGTDKSLKQTIRAVRDAITDLCDPINGSIQNVPENARYKSQKPIDWGHYKGHYNGIYINTQKDYHRKKIDTKSEWNGITFNSIFMAMFHDEWFDAIKLSNLEILNCTIADTSKKAWWQFANGIEKLKNLKILKLQANLKEIPDIVFEKLSPSLQRLNISKNQLICTSFQLYRLINLIEFNLSDNQMEDESGILWTCLPESIKIFNLSNSGVTRIPGSIAYLASLYDLNLTNTKLENVDWPYLSKNLRHLHFGIVQNLEQIRNSSLPRMKTLKVNNNFYQIAPTESLPSTLEELFLPKNHIENFTFNLNTTALTILDLSNNNLKTFPWEFLPNSVRQIDLSHNNLETMGFMKSWIKLTNLNVSYNYITEFDCDFNAQEYKSSGTSWEDWSYMIMGLDFNICHNCLHSLPANFETFTPLRKLDISYNKFIVEDNKNMNSELSEPDQEPKPEMEFDLDERLWKRLPKKGKLKYLNISGNHINILPCIIKEMELVQLDAIDCNLEYICPQISRYTPNLMLMLNISTNSKFKNLPFLPKTILSPPFNPSFQKINELPKPDFTQCYKFTRAGGTENPNRDAYNLKIITDATYPSTEKSKTFKTRLFYDLKKLPDEDIPKNFCKCCANCGNSTKEEICEQLMTMDFEIYENATFIKFYESGIWKTKVHTRLCQGCRELYKTEAQEIVVSSKRKAEKDLELSRNQKKIISKESTEQQNSNEGEPMEVDDESLDHAQQSVYSNNPTIYYQEPQTCNYNINDMNIQLIDETGQHLATFPAAAVNSTVSPNSLPPIITVLPNHYYNTNFSEYNSNEYFQPTTIYQHVQPTPVYPVINTAQEDIPTRSNQKTQENSKDL